MLFFEADFEHCIARILIWGVCTAKGSFMHESNLDPIFFLASINGFLADLVLAKIFA